LIDWWNRTFRYPRQNATKKNKMTKKIFTQRTRRIVRIKQKYGLIGIAVSTPLLLSIPVGVFLVVRYYRSSRSKFLYLIASNMAWSAIYTSFYMLWDDVIFQKA
jgi:hypothetical protein